MNAPPGTGRSPRTSVITMGYGAHPKAAPQEPGGKLFIDVPIAEPAAHTTERSNPGDRRGGRAVAVQAPAPAVVVPPPAGLLPGARSCQEVDDDESDQDADHAVLLCRRCR